MKKIPVIIDCDPGHDDMVALVLALGNEALDVKLVTTVTGNQEITKVDRNALNILNYIGKSDVEVCEGAQRPLVRDLYQMDTESTHGVTGLDGFDFPEENPMKISSRRAVEAIADVLRTSEEKVTLITTAPLTNIGLLIRSYPDVLDKIERISMMGGTCDFVLTTPFMEFNTFMDAEATKIVFESGIPITMFGYDVTYKTLYGDEFLGELEKIDNRTAHMMHSLLKEFRIMHNSAWIDLGGAPVHDALAVAGVIDPSLVVASELMHVDIPIEPGPLSGATLCDRYHRTDLPENVNVVFELDNDRFFKLVLDSVKALA